MNDDQTLVCPNSECNENRYTDNTTVPRAQMSCKSIGMALTQMLLNDETRQLFEYKRIGRASCRERVLRLV